MTVPFPSSRCTVASVMTLMPSRAARETDRRFSGLVTQPTRSSAIVVTYDEHGGYWDHVAPPRADRWGPGIRVPTVIVSPFAKRHFVDHTSYDTTSILRLIEERFAVPPLGERDAKASDMRNAFDFARKARP